MIFPGMVLHFDVGRQKSVTALEHAMMEEQKVFLVGQKDGDEDGRPRMEDLCRWAPSRRSSR